MYFTAVYVLLPTSNSALCPRLRAFSYALEVVAQVGLGVSAPYDIGA